MPNNYNYERERGLNPLYPRGALREVGVGRGNVFDPVPPDWENLGFENDLEGRRFVDWYSKINKSKPDINELLRDPIGLKPFLGQFRKPRYMQEGMTYADLAAPTRAGYEGLSQMYKRGAMMSDPNLFGTIYQNKAFNLFNEDKLAYRSWLDRYLDENINDLHLGAGLHHWNKYLASSRG